MASRWNDDNLLDSAIEAVVDRAMDQPFWQGAGAILTASDTEMILAGTHTRSVLRQRIRRSFFSNVLERGNT